VLLIISLELLHRFEPSRNETLHHMQLTATACLLLTTCILLSLVGADGSREIPMAGKQAIGVLGLVANACFAGWCVLTIAKLSWRKIPDWLACVTAWVDSKRHSWGPSLIALKQAVRRIRLQLKHATMQCWQQLIGVAAHRTSSADKQAAAAAGRLVAGEVEVTCVDN
jgi:hypothetical protein